METENVLRVIFKVTYPNNKIYVGSDLTNDIAYFGSVNGIFIAQDFTHEQRQKFAVVREILWESETATKSEVIKKEYEFIKLFNSNNPEIGYNRHPKFKKIN